MIISCLFKTAKIKIMINFLRREFLDNKLLFLNLLLYQIDRLFLKVVKDQFNYLNNQEKYLNQEIKEKIIKVN